MRGEDVDAREDSPGFYSTWHDALEAVVDVLVDARTESEAEIGLLRVLETPSS